MSSTNFDTPLAPGGLRRLRAGISIDKASSDQGSAVPRTLDQLGQALQNAVDQASASGQTILVLRILHRELPRHVGKLHTEQIIDDEIHERLLSIDPSFVAVASSPTAVTAFIPSVNRRSDAEALVAPVFEVLSPPLNTGGIPHYLSPSVGAAMLDIENTDANLLLEAASLALAETNNTDPAVLFHPYQRTRREREVNIETELHAAVLTNTINAALQPAFSLQTGQIVAMESFARWTQPGRGPVLAPDLIRMSEEIGALYQLGRQVLGKAVQQASGWVESGLISDITLWVNISPIELVHPEFPAAITAAIEFDPRVKIGLEVSPSPPAEEQYVNGVIRSLVSRGARAAIGDFGAGFVDLSIAHQLPFDSVKLNRSLIRQIAGNQRAADIVHSLIGLAGKLDMEVTAQGVENDKQADLLTQMGCTIGQGFFLARPMDADEMTSYLSSSSGN